MNATFFFEKEIENGGDPVRLRVELVMDNGHDTFYHCIILPLEAEMAIGEGGLVDLCPPIDEFNLCMNEHGLWVESIFGTADFYSEIGHIIEQETL